MYTHAEMVPIPGSEKHGAIDNKVVKRHFPRTNNAQVLDFVFEKDPNLFLRKTQSESKLLSSTERDSKRLVLYSIMSKKYE